LVEVVKIGFCVFASINAIELIRRAANS